MDIPEAIEFLDKQILNPRLGLPEEVFLFISRMSPMVNVDLLIKNEDSKTLLAWRDDEFSGAGWHVPGGVLRFKEKLETRVLKVAQAEIGTSVEFDSIPMAMNQIHCSHDTRGHFISFLYKCFLSKEFVPKNLGLTNKDNGFLMWHETCPINLIKVHEIYRQYI